MINIDYIMDLLNWNNSLDDQAKGITLARNVQSINVFLQPCDRKHNKNVWENCAIILAERTDEELSPYLIRLLEWLQDMNWPGAICILDRIRKYADRPSYDFAFNFCIKRAQDLHDDVWLSNLQEINKST